MKTFPNFVVGQVLLVHNFEFKDIRMKYRVLGLIFCLLCYAAQGFGESSFDRELVVTDQNRAAKVETVLRDLLRAYENEDAREFLDYVSEDRFRQDYLTFTDALYNDFRTYEIYRIDYWVDRVVGDHMKQFFYVRWEKRYETLDDARQMNEKGFSRFVFDEINGEYLLIELAGNDLFGSSLAEWTNETPSISGQEQTNTSGTSASTPDLVMACATYDDSSPSVATHHHEFYIKNQGTAASGPSVIRTGTCGVGAELSLNVPSISPGQTVLVKDGGSAPCATYRLDFTSVVSESNEGNNNGMIPVGAFCP